ncbi:hypothetical protein KC332_g10336 [Hortaea werneckii]|nr:hypothetical protein KC358_g7761 [Hortaea werneckii]KAI6836959.1 hypothetical protein KC350_g6173 [Hortaea werneckii]KAI6921024.1 hypothetical protein KC341_g16208 [Hortaea werneckii]KAI6921425.1 hypothetical protein KC348_g10148 [Hortaea werneckii]KAI6965516.1 hypothetical protein KC321_g10065 [Hortaea werneckii]
MNPSFLVALQGAAIGSVVAGATCYDHLIIDTRGTGELRGTSIGFAAIIDQVKESVPNVGVHYTIYPTTSDVTQFAGATVTNEVLQEHEPTGVEGQAIEAVLLIGNPYRQPLKQGKRGQDCGNSTADASGALDELGLETSDVWYETGNVRDI